MVDSFDLEITRIDTVKFCQKYQLRLKIWIEFSTNAVYVCVGTYQFLAMITGSRFTK